MISENILKKYEIMPEQVYYRDDINRDFDKLLKDYEGLEKINAEITDSEEMRKVSQQSKEALLKETDCAIFIYDDEELVGASFMLWTAGAKYFDWHKEQLDNEGINLPEKLCVMTGLRIHPKAKRQGLGRRIMMTQNEYARQLGMRPFGVTSEEQVEAVKFHTKLGAKIIKFKKNYVKERYVFVIYEK